MDFLLAQFEHVDVLLAEPAQVVDVLGADDVPFFEGPPLEGVLDDLGDVVRQDHAHRLLHRDNLPRRLLSHLRLVKSARPGPPGGPDGAGSAGRQGSLPVRADTV